MNKTLIVIVGPTAIGKTELAIKIARTFETEILSADSRQFYREMNIGTAKPSAEELGLAKHHFIDFLGIQEEYTVGDYEKDALALLDELFKSRDTVLLVGGSGLFVNAVTDGFDDLPKAAPGVREELNRLFSDQGIEALQKQLLQEDPEYFSQVDKSNPQRLIRALEVCISTGQPFSSFRQRKRADRSFRVVKLGLNTERTALYNRINERVDKMISSGLVQEVESLYKHRNLNALQTVGYSELFDYLDGTKTLEEAIEQIKQNTRRYAKRQLTWFRKDTSTLWFEPTDEEKILRELKEKISG